MGAEKFFCVESWAFLVVFWGLLLFLDGVSGFVGWWFCALSMLFSVTFNVAKREVCACCWLCGKRDFGRRTQLFHIAFFSSSLKSKSVNLR